MPITVEFKRLAHGKDLPLPAYQSDLAAGFDLRAALAEPLALASGERALVATGFAMAIPAGFEGQVRPRSGLAAKNGVTVLNTPGTVDADYRGEVKVILINHGPDTFQIGHGDRDRANGDRPCSSGGYRRSGYTFGHRTRCRRFWVDRQQLDLHLREKRMATVCHNSQPRWPAVSRRFGEPK